MIGSLKQKISRTRLTFTERFIELLHSDKNREEILEDLAETLILADVGVTTTEKIISSIREKSRKTDTFPTIRKLLEEELVGPYK